MHYIMYLLLLHNILQLVMYKNNTFKNVVVKAQA